MTSESLKTVIGLQFVLKLAVFPIHYISIDQTSHTCILCDFKYCYPTILPLPRKVIILFCETSLNL